MVNGCVTVIACVDCLVATPRHVGCVVVVVVDGEIFRVFVVCLFGGMR